MSLISSTIFSAIPPYVRMQILNYLDDGDLFCRVALVCKEFQNMAMEEDYLQLRGIERFGLRWMVEIRRGSQSWKEAYIFNAQLALAWLRQQNSQNSQEYDIIDSSPESFTPMRLSLEMEISCPVSSQE